MRVFITGISGLIGSALARCLLASGHEVRGSVRPQNVGRSEFPGVVGHLLGEPLPAGALDGVDVLVHCSYDFDSAHAAKNLEGTKQLLSQAGARRTILLSSYSAHASAVSTYGQVKRELEASFAQGVVVRAGLVIGRGGLFARMVSTIRRTPVLPVLDGGRKLVPIIASADLTAALTGLVIGDVVGTFNLANAEPVTILTLTSEIERAMGRRPLHVPVPAKRLLPLVWLLERLRIPLPVSSQNIEGYIANDVFYPSDLHRFVERESTLAAMVKAAVS